MKVLWKISGIGLALWLSGCTGCVGPEGGPDGGANRPDPCNSVEDALAKAECEVKVGGDGVTAYLSFASATTGSDRDFYRVELPTTLTARSLVRIYGGYGAPNTAVNFSLNVLREDGSSSIARGTDTHGQAKPRPVDLIFPYSQGGTKLILLVQDDPVNPALPNYDSAAQYTVKAEVSENPDVNEPNDTTPTDIPLAASGGVSSGTQSGYLATNDDVDQFKITVPAFTAPPRKVLYVHITAPARTNPPPPYRVSFVLTAPNGTVVQEGQVANEFLAVDLATARIASPGDYKLTVKAYRPTGVNGPLPGDLTYKYTVDVKLMDELDPNEPNDAVNTGYTFDFTGITPGGTGSLKGRNGRIDHLPDPEWFRVSLPAAAVPTRLHYRMTAVTNGTPRFNPIPGPRDRQVRLHSAVAGATHAAQVTACLNDSTVCPKGLRDNPTAEGAVTTLCNPVDQSVQPLCLWSERAETSLFDNLRNFEGIIPIPAHASTVAYTMLVQDESTNWADDRDYTLQVEWLDDDPTEVTPAGPQTIFIDEPTSGSFPTPPAGATNLTGTISYGYGAIFDHDITRGQGVRGPNDYDAVISDVDSFQLDFPASPTAPLDRTWELEWSVDRTADGGYAHELGLQITFCDGDRLDGGSCTPVGTGSRGEPLGVAYTDEALHSWHNSTGALQKVYDHATAGGKDTTTVRAYGCYCIEPRFMRGGFFKIDVVGIDRDRYEEVPYRIRTALTSYPKSYGSGLDGGAMLSCPPPAGDAGTPDPDGGTDGGSQPARTGCRFTDQSL